MPSRRSDETYIVNVTPSETNSVIVQPQTMIKWLPSLPTAAQSPSADNVKVKFAKASPLKPKIRIPGRTIYKPITLAPSPVLIIPKPITTKVPTSANIRTTHQDRPKTYNGQINRDAYETDTETIESDLDTYEKNMMSTPNERGFAQFKAKLVMNKLSQTLERGSRNITDDILIAQRRQLINRRETLIERLKDVEDEISMFQKENLMRNGDLIKMKQEHKLDKVRFEQEREEAEAKLSDERVKMEVHFHDERMRIKEKHGNRD